MHIDRDILSEIINCLDSGKVLILKGARQVGKTTLMMDIKNRLSGMGKKTFYISADEDFDHSIFQTPQHFIARLESETDLSAGLVYVFIDEFQYIKNAGKFIKVLYDKYRYNMQLIVSGSSSLEITKNSEFLTGRKIEFPIHRIAFTEFLGFKEPGIADMFRKTPYNFNKWKLLYEVHATRIEILFAQFAQFGGYPEILTTENYSLKKTLIRELISTYIQKDIIAFLKVENVSAFNNLLKVLCSETSNLLNKHSLANTLGISINTLNKYLDILQGTYVCRFLAPFHTNTRKEVSKMKKIFINDNGLRNFILNRFPPSYDDINGQEAENLAFLALKHHTEEERFFYFRTISKSEIDFIVDSGEKKAVVEVKFQNKVSSVPLAMRNFAKRYNTKKFVVVTKRSFKETEDAFFIPLYLFELFIQNNKLLKEYNHD
jgi:predicted AAA+ superfamily ATPase